MEDWHLPVAEQIAEHDAAPQHEAANVAIWRLSVCARSYKQVAGVAWKGCNIPSLSRAPPEAVSTVAHPYWLCATVADVVVVDEVVWLLEAWSRDARAANGHDAEVQCHVH